MSKSMQYNYMDTIKFILWIKILMLALLWNSYNEMSDYNSYIEILIKFA